MADRILLHTPDITLKGKNQNEFKNKLVANIRKRLVHHQLKWQVVAGKGRINIRVPDGEEQNTESILQAMRQTPGVSSVSQAKFIAIRSLVNDEEFIWEELEAIIADMGKGVYRENATFAVQVNRTYKQIPVKSNDIASRLGAVLIDRTDWKSVRLNNPGQKFFIDIYPDGFYLYANKLKGMGGLPVGSAGRVLALFSGGIDSPVAVYQMAKRGCNVEFIHFSAMHADAETIDASVIGKLAKQLSLYTQHSRLHVFPYTYFDLALIGKHTGYELVMFRRFMMRMAETLANKVYCLALVNGDSLGQVASQTLENIASSNAVISLPVFRPLIGSNKEEIIDQARNIGTFDISIQPYKDCCALIGHGPKTRTSHEKVNLEESHRLTEYQEVIDKTFDDGLRLEYKFGELVSDV